MVKRTKLATAIKLAALGAAGAAMLSATPVFAQDELSAIEEVMVTGSRIKSDGFDSVSPVSVTTAQDIKVSGFTRIEDMMNSLPQLEAGQTSFISNGATGTASLDLRGLGAQRTLTLVNGRRLQSGGVYSQSPDINQIPAALVERIDVLTGGASATYGADAVAGVVNFIMKKDFEGFEINLGAAGYQHDNDNKYIQNLMDKRNFDYPTGDSGIDGKSYNIDFTMGSAFADGKGHATAYATWRKNDELRQEARDYSSCALNSAGTGCGGSGNAIVPNFYVGALDADGALDFGDYEYWTLDQNSNFIASSGNVYNYAPVNHFMRPDERYSLGAFVNYELSDMFKPYMEVSYANDRTAAQIAESGTFFNQQYNIAANSPLLTAAQQQQIQTRFGLAPTDLFATYIGKRNVEGGPRASVLEHNAFRIVIGTEGDINDSWSYDASFLYGSTSSSAVYINDFFGPRIATALDSDGESCATTDGCVPYEVFTYQGVTPEQAATLTGTGILNGTTATTVFNAYVSGDTGLTIPSANEAISVVAGVEIRQEEFSRTSDEVFAKGLLLGQGGPTASLNGDYKVKELFTEARLPIASGMTGIQDLTVDLALRLSDYSNFGSNETYKVGFNYQPIDMLRVRAGYNRAVRAPNIAELFAEQNIGLWSGSDPCSGTTPVASAAACANSGVTAAQYGNIAASPANQYNQLSGGEPGLQQETADTYTFGVVVDPIDDLTFSIDYWDIQMEDMIGAVGASNILTQCVNAGALCNLVNRGPSGSLWLGEAGYVINNGVNLGKSHFEGVDLAATWNLDMGSAGYLTTTMTGVYTMTKEFDPLPGEESLKYDCAGVVDENCFVTPKWRHTVAVTYGTGDFWSVTAKWRFFDAVDYEGTTDKIASDELSSQSYFDLKASFDVNENLDVLVGINNVLDEEPPMVGGTLSSNANTVAGYYDTLGRYLHASATFKF